MPRSISEPNAQRQREVGGKKADAPDYQRGPVNAFIPDLGFVAQRTGKKVSECPIMDALLGPTNQLATEV